jgi:hypothetical protein
MSHIVSPFEQPIMNSTCRIFTYSIFTGAAGAVGAGPAGKGTARQRGNKQGCQNRYSYGFIILFSSGAYPHVVFASWSRAVLKLCAQDHTSIERSLNGKFRRGSG